MQAANPPVPRNSLGKANSSQCRSITVPDIPCQIKPQVSLASFTSFRVGGPAEWYVAPRRIEELQASLEWANSEGLPITIVGGGSNLLVSDRGIPGLAIGTRHLRFTHFDAETGQLSVAAGQSLPRLAWRAAQMGWSGLEWAVGIPGTVGGAVVMNAGAHNACTADILVTAQVLEPNGRLSLLTPEDLGYRYRTSVLQGGDRLVTQATFQLQPGGDPAQIQATTSKQLEMRKSTQPYHLPSCGSVFRNPSQDLKAGWLIEQTGLKGYQIGGAQVAERHANFILNCGGATARDIFQLIEHVQQQVEQRWSVRLEPEVRTLGEF
ncbi:UDP-N-acetylmuramate dehydrogenase [Phormidium sp. CCY1219]|nr:UDP-N-acetylmuramate dehydrogenase [Phormidium sp. CCY1219]MEB3828020.1 UDP-N-acetylmuramate dehydrogenase [Phormidium sp. CCY1219]